MERDLDFLVYGGDEFRSVGIFAFAEEVRIRTGKDVDAFEIREVNQDSDFFKEFDNDWEQHKSWILFKKGIKRRGQPYYPSSA